MEEEPRMCLIRFRAKFMEENMGVKKQVSGQNWPLAAKTKRLQFLFIA
uniref:Uncharacterized protein n=1 Tax=Serinus canaria TaxID=9135 RepID=A0A8C9L1E4_SERCA